jgi:hypothetical protein
VPHSPLDELLAHIGEIEARQLRALRLDAMIVDAVLHEKRARDHATPAPVAALPAQEALRPAA